MNSFYQINRKATAYAVAIMTLSLLFMLFSLGTAQGSSNIFVTGGTSAYNGTINNGLNNVYTTPTATTVGYTQTYNYNTNQVSNQATTSAAPDYCQTPANQSRPECQGAVNNTYTNTNYTTTYTNNGLPDYCSNPANANRPECQVGTTQVYQQPTQQTTQVNTGQVNTGQVPAYCQTPANQSRSECQGQSYQPTTTSYQQPTTTGYPSYCYQVEYSTRTECQGLYAPIATTPVTQTVPNYCSYPEYQFRAECQTQVNQVTILNPNNQVPAYCTNPANQFLVACQQNTTVTAPTTGAPAYCQTPANQNRPECLGTVSTPTVSTVTPQPCQAGYYIPNCVNVTIPTQTVSRPCIVGIYDPLCNPTVTNPVTPAPLTIALPPAPVAPISCPPGVSGENCVDASDFALPIPPAPMNCQQSAGNTQQTIRDFCSAIYFTHSAAYTGNSAIATLRPFQQFSFLIRSPYAGHAYIFSRSADGSIQALLPNQQIPQTVSVKLYDQVHIPNDVNTLGTNYSFTMNSPIIEVFYVVLSQPAPNPNFFANVRSDQDLQTSLLNLGLVNGIYHGIAGSPVITGN